MHPLVEITHYDHIIPICKFCQRVKCMKRKPNFKYSLRKTFLEELDLKMSKTERMVTEDPFLMLGYGINAFFGLCF